MGMFTESVIAIDGSKFKAVNSSDNNYTERKLKVRIAQTEKRVARYLEELDRADQQGDALPEAHVDQLKTRLKEAKALLNPVRYHGNTAKRKSGLANIDD